MLEYAENAFAAGASPQTRLRELTMLPDPLVGWEGDTPPQTPPPLGTRVCPLHIISGYATALRWWQRAAVRLSVRVSVCLSVSASIASTAQPFTHLLGILRYKRCMCYLCRIYATKCLFDAGRWLWRQLTTAVVVNPLKCRGVRQLHIKSLQRSGLSARVPECQKLKMQVRPGPRCKSKTGRQNQDQSRLSTNHRRSWRDRSRPVLDCNASLDGKM